MLYTHGVPFGSVIAERIVVLSLRTVIGLLFYDRTARCHRARQGQHFFLPKVNFF